MTIILGFILSHIGIIGTALGGIALAVGTWFHGKSAATKQLQPQVDAAKQTAVVAQEQTQLAQANADAANAGTAAVVNKSDAVAAAAGKTDAQLRKDMSDEFGS